ncbi:MAG: hypothetical protein GY772_28220 [bacterium]|nr:hypothetical protein [bacterium]
MAETLSDGRMSGWVHRSEVTPTLTGHTKAQIANQLAMAAKGDPREAQWMRDAEDARKRGGGGGSTAAW